MKKIFTIKLDTEITIDFSSFGLSDAEQRGDEATKKLIVHHFFEECGVDEFEVSDKNGGNLFEAIAEVIKSQNDYALALENDCVCNCIVHP